MFEESNCGLKISGKDLSVIVSVYAKGINRGIRKKAIVVVYIKLWTDAQRIVGIIKNFNQN